MAFNPVNHANRMIAEVYMSEPADAASSKRVGTRTLVRGSPEPLDGMRASTGTVRGGGV